MRKVKELLHHHHAADNTTSTTSSGHTTYANTTTTSTTAPLATTAAVAEREIIGDKIDRRGTGEERLAKHTVLPGATTTTAAPLGTRTAATSGVIADREIIGDKIDRKGTGEERLSKHTHLPVDTLNTANRSSLTSELAHTATVAPVVAAPVKTETIKTETVKTAPIVAPVKTEKVRAAPVVAPAAPIVAPSAPAVATKVMNAPIHTERVAKPAVVQERIIPIQKEEIQPIIYREREQLDVKQVTEKLHETKIKPTIIQERSLAPEVKEAIVMRGAPITPNVVAPSTRVEATRSSTLVHQPIVQETIKKTIVEEVQPVLEREVIAPTLIKEVQPIYEKIVEAPRVFKEVLPVRDLGVVGSATEFQQSGFSHPNLLNNQQGSLLNNQSGLASGLSQPGFVQQQPGLLNNQQQAPLMNSQQSLTGKVLNVADQKLKQFEANQALKHNNQGSLLNNQQSSSLNPQIPSTH